MALVQTEPKKVYLWGTEVSKIFLWDKQVRPKVYPYLCFTANAAGSTVKLNKSWSPTAVTLETSTDGNTWSTYTIWNTITLSSVWDKVYFRNTSETTTRFSTSGSSIYYFWMTWSIDASWDLTYLINKNCTDTIVWTYTFCYLFSSCNKLRRPPSLPATNLTNYCYYKMFNWCSGMIYLPKLPATTLKPYCYQEMFDTCSSIALSTTQSWTYQNQYRIPITWTWTDWWNSLYYMFNNTWWLVTNPSINTTYYTSNTVV